MSVTWEAARAEIRSYAALEADWDGYGAAPLKPEAIAEALAFSELVEAAGYWPPVPGPAGDGEVNLWWYVPTFGDARGRRVHIDLGFYGTGSLSFYARSEGNAKTGADDLPVDRLPDSLVPHLEAHRRLKAEAGRDCLLWARDAGVPVSYLSQIGRAARRDVHAWLRAEAAMGMAAAGRFISLRCLFENARQEHGRPDDGVDLRQMYRFWHSPRLDGPMLGEILSAEAWDGRAVAAAFRALWRLAVRSAAAERRHAEWIDSLPPERRQASINAVLDEMPVVCACERCRGTAAEAAP